MTPWLASTATKIPAEAAGRVLVTGSHAGAIVGHLALRGRVRALIASDAGVGLDGAGIAGLGVCERAGVAAAAIAHDSARIGDAEDLMARGIVSHCNGPAAAAGCRTGMSCREAAALLGAAPLVDRSGSPDELAEARSVAGRTPNGLLLVCVDSVSLVVAKDAGQIVLSGSHGGLVAGQHHLAIRVAAAAAFFNDAGIGADEAGVSRLPVLDARGVAAAAVAAHSARIGDARSTLATGVISRVNEAARRQGMQPDMPVREATLCIGVAAGADRAAPKRPPV